MQGPAQTIDSVGIIPLAPVTATPVKVVVYGYFTSLTSFISTNAYYLGGNVYQVDVQRCQGMATAIDYTRDTVTLGLLPAGVYSVSATMYSAGQDVNGNCPALSATGNGSSTFTVMQSTATGSWPDPATATVFYSTSEKHIVVLLPEEVDGCWYTLVDASGRALQTKFIQRSGKSTCIGTDAPPGLYLVKLDDGRKSVVRKIVIR